MPQDPPSGNQCARLPVRHEGDVFVILVHECLFGSIGAAHHQLNQVLLRLPVEIDVREDQNALVVQRPTQDARVCSSGVTRGSNPLSSAPQAASSFLTTNFAIVLPQSSGRALEAGIARASTQ